MKNSILFSVQKAGDAVECVYITSRVLTIFIIICDIILIMIVGYWTDESTVKYDIDVCKTFKARTAKFLNDHGREMNGRNI